MGDKKVEVEEKYKCLTRTVKTTVRMRIVSAETAQILGNREIVKTTQDKQCKDKMGTVASVQSLLDEALAQAAGEMAVYVAPTFKLLKEDFAKLKVGKYKKNGDKAAKLAEDGELDDLNQAYIIYQAMYEEDPYNTNLLYNLGLLNEAVGNFAVAKEMYENALFLKSDEKDYQKAFDRIQKASEFSDVLKELGLSVTQHEWGASAVAMAQATATKLVVKGSNTDRQPVRETADKAGGVVVRVPGGIELPILSREGEWFRVKLLGNKEGYLHKSQVGKIK